MTRIDEILRGQRRLTPHVDLKSGDVGKTLFEVKEPATRVYRIGIALISLGCMGLFAVVLLNWPNSNHSTLATVLRIVFWLATASWAGVALMALLGLPPFQGKRRRL